MLFFIIGSLDEILLFDTMNLKQSEFKSHKIPRDLSGSEESHSTSSDVAFLSGSMLSITRFKMLAHFFKLNAAILMFDISW